MISPESLLIATRNAHKTEEIRAMLGSAYSVEDLNGKDLPAVEETGTTFLENARLKAVEISKLTTGLILSDDSGLEVDALGGDPGVYSSRYAGTDGDDAANNKKLIAELAKLPTETDRSARFRCVMVLAQDGEMLAHFSGSVEGKIISELTGEGGFGYDPLFIPHMEDGNEQTFAQLGDAVKCTMSHRARALEQVIEWLKTR